MSWIGKLIATFRPKRLDEELDWELQFHLEQRADELIAQGMKPEEAHRQAARLFGNRTAIQESARDRDVLVWLETTLHDLRFAARTLRRNPGFAAAAVLSLALGIGANTGLFSLLDALLLKLLPVAEPRQLVQMREGESDAFRYPLFDVVRTRSKLLSGASAMARYYRELEIEERGEIASVALQTVSVEYFDLLGVSPWRGRFFHRTDAESQDEPIAVISEAYWRRHYGGHLSALGAHFRANGFDFTIAGIAPPDFQGMLIDTPADIWIPFDRATAAYYAQFRGIEVIGRLRPGATQAQAAAEASSLLGRRVQMVPAGNGISFLRARFSRPLVVLECVVGLVLLIACANLANLMLAGAASRQREISVRQAIGAGRARLVRQLLTESLLVSAIGGALAILVAQWLSRAILRFLPPDAAPAVQNLSFHPDPRVLGLTASLALLTCLLFGLAPAIRATRPSLTPGLKETSGGGRSAGRWSGRALVVCEVALCTILLIGAGLFVRSLRHLRDLDSGFVAEHVLVANVSAPRQYPQAQVRQRAETLREQAAALPGVRAAGLSHIRPLSGFNISGKVEAEGHVPKPQEETDTYDLSISPEFFAAMGTPLLEGRDFSDHDHAGTRKVAIVNESFARQFFPGQDPVGRHFGIEGPSSAGAIEIVGLVKDTRWIDLRRKPPAMYYRPSRQSGIWGECLAVRTTADLSTVAAALERIVHDIDPRLTLKDVVPFTEMEDRTLVIERLVAQVSAAFGVLALVVACVGLYGVLAYGVARRTREIGVRMALGASRGGVQWMVLRESLVLLGLGFALGVPAALAATRLVASMLFGLRPADPVTMAAALTVMAAVSLAAAWVPARRAARVDPMVALRYE